MQLQKLLSNLTKQQKLALAACAALLFTVIIVSLTASKGDPARSGKKTTVVDKNSGESVHTIAGENETFGAEEVKPYLLGTDSLVKIGLSNFQITTLKDSVYDYSKKNNLSVKKASISVKEIAIDAPLFDASGRRLDSPQTTITAPMTLDDKNTIYIVLTYGASDEIKVIFKGSKDGAAIYDSGLKIDTPAIGEEDDD